MPNDKKRREKELAIFEAVLRLTARGADLAGLKVQQIAAEADIGKGTVYEYFPSKDAILQGLTAYCLENELDRLEATAGACATLENLLDAVLAYLSDLAQNRAGIYRIVAIALGSTRQTGRCCPDPAFTTRLRTLMHELLARLRAAGEVDPDLDEEYCLYALSAASVSCVVLLTAGFAAHSGATAPETVLQSTRLLLRRALCLPKKPEVGY